MKPRKNELPMTGKELEDACARLGITLVDLSRVIDTDRSVVYRWTYYGRDPIQATPRSGRLLACILSTAQAENAEAVGKKIRLAILRRDLLVAARLLLGEG